MTDFSFYQRVLYGYDPQSTEEWALYNRQSREWQKANNTEQYRRSQKTTSAKKGYCQWCCYVPPPNHSRLQGLFAHHLKPIHGGGSNSDGLVTLCHGCHKDVHSINGVVCWHKVDPVLTQCLINLFGPLSEVKP